MWDEKPGAKREFLPKAKGERREGRPGGNFRQEIYRRGVPPPPLVGQNKNTLKVFLFCKSQIFTGTGFDKLVQRWRRFFLGRFFL